MSDERTPARSALRTWLRQALRTGKLYDLEPQSGEGVGALRAEAEDLLVALSDPALSGRSLEEVIGQAKAFRWRIERVLRDRRRNVLGPDRPGRTFFGQRDPDEDFGPPPPPRPAPPVRRPTPLRETWWGRVRRAWTGQDPRRRSPDLGNPLWDRWLDGI